MKSDSFPVGLKAGEEVDLLIGNPSDLGINVIVNGKYQGLLYHNEIFQPLKRGEIIKGFVKKLREDGKLDVTLHKFGYRKVEPNAEKIMKQLKEKGGMLRLTDKSNPQEIVEQLQMSKKTFKKAIGALYKQRLIGIEDDGIYLK